MDLKNTRASGAAVMFDPLWAAAIIVIIIVILVVIFG